jgi:hypothetical protein
MPREEFKQEVDRHLTGQETEPHEILYFKVYRSQLPVIERALETAGLMLGSNKSRGYCLEMICADFLAGANLSETSHRFDYAKITKFDASTPKTTSTQTGSKKIRNCPDARARTRWLAVPRVRFHGRPGGPSHQTQEPARRRCDAQLDYTLRQLSWQMARRAPVETRALKTYFPSPIYPVYRLPAVQAPR